jgi:hypothetical protein
MRTAIAAILILIVVAACSPQWYYPHLGWLLPWYVGDYISLEPGQKSELEKRLERQLAWHCRTQLPAYAAFLRSVAEDFADPERPVTQERFRRYQRILKRYWRDLMARIGPDVADLLMSASASQLDELFRNIEERNRELEEKYVDPPEEEIYRNRDRRMTDRLAKWIGGLEEAQHAAVREWSAQMGADNAPWMANRRRVQGAFRDLLATRTTDPAFKPRFVHLLTSPEALRTGTYQAISSRHTTFTLDLLVKIGGTLTEAQRRRFLSTLGAWAEDFDHLTCPTLQTAAQ